MPPAHFGCRNRQILHFGVIKECIDLGKSNIHIADLGIGKRLRINAVDLTAYRKISEDPSGKRPPADTVPICDLRYAVGAENEHSGSIYISKAPLFDRIDFVRIYIVARRHIKIAPLVPSAHYPADLFKPAHGTFKFQNAGLIAEAYKQFPAASAYPLGRLCVPFLFRLPYRLPFLSMPAYYIIYERLFANFHFP